MHSLKIITTGYSLYRKTEEQFYRDIRNTEFSYFFADIYRRSKGTSLSKIIDSEKLSLNIKINILEGMEELPLSQVIFANTNSDNILTRFVTAHNLSISVLDHLKLSEKIEIEKIFRSFLSDIPPLPINLPVFEIMLHSLQHEYYDQEIIIAMSQYAMRRLIPSHCKQRLKELKHSQPDLIPIITLL